MQEDCFYYNLPVLETLGRFLNDDSIRDFIVHIPTFTKDSVVHRTFSDGSLIHSMNIRGPYMLLRVYLDAFATNNPLGSSHQKDKILAFYYSLFVKLKFGSSRKTVQTIAFVKQSDVDNFGLKTCLKDTISDLKSVVEILKSALFVASVTI